jgi:hypothetical protein
LLPYTVREGPLAAASTIPARTKEALPPALRVQRALHKLDTRLRRVAFNQRWLHAATVARVS